MENRKKIAILASYNGSGFETIQNAILEGVLNAEVCVIITNNSNAGVLQKAEKFVVMDNKTKEDITSKTLKACLAHSTLSDNEVEEILKRV